jgi:hypothetical protein
MMNERKNNQPTNLSREVTSLLQQIEIQRRALERSIKRINQISQTPLEMANK